MEIHFFLSPPPPPFPLSDGKFECVEFWESEREKRRFKTENSEKIRRRLIEDSAKIHRRFSENAKERKMRRRFRPSGEGDARTTIQRSTKYRPDAGLSRGTEEEMKMELTLREREIDRRISTRLSSSFRCFFRFCFPRFRRVLLTFRFAFVVLLSWSL